MDYRMAGIIIPDLSGEGAGNPMQSFLFWISYESRV
jgi:hypothetical protein